MSRKRETAREPAKDARSVARVQAKPKVSCLMVSRPHPLRFRHFKMSVQCFLWQTYPNKELVILCDPRGDLKCFRKMKNWIARLPSDKIQITLARRTRSLGALRNQILQIANGEVGCLWDDDDLFHPERIALQLRKLLTQKRGAVYLQDVIHYWEPTQEVFWARWNRVSLGGHPGTGMFFLNDKGNYPTRGPSSQINEDAKFFLKMRSKTTVSFLKRKPHLYVYKYHGENVSKQAHHYFLKILLASKTRSVKKAQLVKNLKAIFGDMIRVPTVASPS